MPVIHPTKGIVRKPPAVITPPKIDGKRQLSNWLGAFLDYTAELESPSIFLKWAGLSTIAGAAQRKIFAETTAYLAFPNLYVVLVGPAGSKKSTAIRMGKRLLKQVPGVNFTSDAPSVAGLIMEFKELASGEHQSLNAFISELSTLYENASETMTGFLTAIYDGDDDYIKRTRVGSKESVPRPWLNLIAGTTPTWLGDNLSRSAVEGGLVARTLYVYSEEVIIQSPFPRYTPELRRLESALVHDLAQISILNGVFDFDGGAQGDAYTWYDRWYRDRSRLPKVADNRTAGYFTRKPQHLLKVAMLIALASRNELTYRVSDLEGALELLNFLEPGMVKAFSSVGGNTFATDLERIAAQILSCGKGGMTEAEIMTANYHQLDHRTLKETIQYLLGMKRIRAGVIKNGDQAGKAVFVSSEYVTSQNGQHP